MDLTTYLDTMARLQRPSRGAIDSDETVRQRGLDMRAIDALSPAQYRWLMSALIASIGGLDLASQCARVRARVAEAARGPNRDDSKAERR